jgi:HlyD family secretion protein
MSEAMSYASAGEHSWYADIPRSTRGPTLFGIAVIGAWIAGFGLWGGTAPIAGAVVATGAFVATGQNKIIQHLEGGVIRQIAVREGDVVEPGQLLIQLDEVAPRAELRRLELRQLRLQAMDIRLQAEMREDAELALPAELTNAAADSESATILESQRLLFAARRNSLESEIATLHDGIKALQERIAGNRAQEAGVHAQLKLLEEEIEAKTYLLKTGLVRKPELLALQRTRANLEGEVGRLLGEMGDAKERIARAWEQIASAKKAAIKTAVEQLHDARGELNDVRERLRTARGVLDRVRITAPVSGVVVKMRYHTSGGVVEAGKDILEILPLQEELIIEVRVRPQDIDHVKRGQQAMVRLTALSKRLTPIVAGEVIYLSADAVPDDKRALTQVASDGYVVRVKLDPNDVASLHNFTPTPGMPAEVYIKTGDRTFFEYLTRPIRDSMARAFREF